MADTRQLKVVVVGDSKSAQAALKRLGSSLEDTNRKASMLTRGWSGFGNAFSRTVPIIAGGIAAAGAGIGMLGALGIRTAANFEQLNVSFTTLLKSSAKAKDEMAWLSASAAATPFELGDLAAADRTMLGFGFSAEKTRRSFLMSMGDMAAAVGMPSSALPDLARVFGQVHAAGVVSMEEINMLIDRGVPIWDMLSKATGRNVQELRKDIEARKLSAATFEKAAHTYTKNNFAGAMEKQSQTLAGLWSTLKDNVSMAAMKMVEPLVPLIKEWMPKLAEGAGKAGDFMTEKLVPALRAVANDLGNAISFIRDNEAWLGPLAAGLGTIAAAIWVIGAATKAWVAIQTIFNVVAAMNPIGLWIVAIMGLIAAIAYLWNHNEGFRKAVMAIWSGIKNGVMATVRWFKDDVPRYFRAVVDWVKKNWPLILAIITGPIGLAVWFIVKNWSKITATFKAVMSAIRSAATGAFNRVVATVAGAIGKVVGFFTGMKARVLGVLKGAAGWLLDIGRRVIDGFVDGLKGGFTKVKDALGKLTSFLPDWKGPARLDKVILRPAGRDIIGGLVDGFRDRFPVVRETLGGLTGDIAGTAIAAAGGGGPVTVIVNVAGSVVTEQELADVLAGPVRDRIARTGKRNGGSTGV